MTDPAMTRPYRPATLASDLATWTHHELRDEIERLRELFGIDSEQHAIHVREIEARHEIRHKHYCAEIERLRAEVEALRTITQMPLDDYVEQLRRRLEASEAALVNAAGIMHRFKE